ncbi:deoxyribodipyrimidine photolyase [Yoonia sp.]|uniref:FAD-binding domain-containing protein n=1 Tax=Yoonia sp. TaxID=2212373 RepID=UPI00236C563F|nr:FAD-binding domain-containing protein [Yoonia sp.]MDB4111964.1 deoxyribodipyrimidine photolyase [Yoonia sp.]
MTEMVPTRAAGLAAMQAFIPAMGRRYENGRNYDHGPGQHKAVSMLSPYICRRLITEAEVVTAALDAHGPEDAEKFIEEVIWRGYHKGWLERRPQVWDSYVQGLNTDLMSLKRDRRLRRDIALAETGQTGLDYFDTWAQELVETGYLHNHARMWFASIWIFTLGLPWRLGADFFYRHLLDGDAASNTLGWRWAAGLHTRGKPYPARAQNIDTFTDGRFTPKHGELAQVEQGLEASEPDGLPTVQPLCKMHEAQTDLPTVLLITDEDCLIEDFDHAHLDLQCAATLSCSHLRSPLQVSEHVYAFETGALADAALRSNLDMMHLKATEPSVLADWAAKAGAKQILTPYVTHGPLRDWFNLAEPYLVERGVTLCEQRRAWDEAIWPHATAGFFKVRKQIPRILEQTIGMEQR